MAIASGKVEVRPANWLKETWQWKVSCGERHRFFLTERAAKRFMAQNKEETCERTSRLEYDMREVDDGKAHVS